MLIVSQDKTKITENMNLWIEELWENTEFERKLFYIKNPIGTLGTYETKRRAKEVLQEIKTAYGNFSYFKNATKEGKDYIINLLKHKYEQFDIYEMPKE